MIDTDELDVDDDFASNDNEHLLLEDSDFDKQTVVEEAVSNRRLTRKRKQIHNVVSPPTKRKKVESKQSEKVKKSNNSTLSCDICGTYSHKDNLLRHVKNKH